MTDTTSPQTARYRHRTPEVEAVQWTGSNADQLRAFCGPDFDEIELDDRVEDPDQTAAIREADHGTWRGLAPGDWVVRLDGGLYEFSAANFAKQYEPAAPPAPADRAGLRELIRRAVCEAEGFAWDSDMLEPDEYGDHADLVLSVLPPATDRAASYRLAADAIERMQGYPHLILPEEIVAALRLLATGAQPDPGSPAYTRRLAAGERDEQQAHPAEHTWAAELHDPLTEEWVPGTRYLVRDRAVNALAHARSIGPTWRDGTPTERRLVRATTTYTVETPAAAPVAGQPPADTGEEARPRFVRVCIACPECDHTLDENGACANGCHVPPAVVAEPGKEA